MNIKNVSEGDLVYDTINECYGIVDLISHFENEIGCVWHSDKEEALKKNGPGLFISLNQIIPASSIKITNWRKKIEKC